MQTVFLLFGVILATFISSSEAFVPHLSVHSTCQNKGFSSISPSLFFSNKLSGPNVQPPRPNANTYWVSEQFLAGEYPTDKRGETETREKLRRYLDVGIDSFLDLTQEGEKLSYESILKEEAHRKGMIVEYRRFPVLDFGVPSKGQMEDILDHLDGTIERSKKAYVHCRGGIGRTGTTVGCFLVRHGNTGGEALDELQRLFLSSDRSYESPSAPETDPQRNFVRQWENNN